MHVFMIDQLVIGYVGCYFFFFFNDTATTEIYTLSLHDALPIWCALRQRTLGCTTKRVNYERIARRDRKSTRLNSSHSQISYAVFCLKKKKRPPSNRDSTHRRWISMLPS